MIRILLALVLTIGTLVGCQQVEEPKTEAVQEQTVTVTISEFGESTSEQELTFEGGQNLLEVLEANMDIEAPEGFITTIEGKTASQEEQEYWAFLVNGEMASVGAGDYELQANDEITFDLQNWE